MKHSIYAFFLLVILLMTIGCQPESVVEEVKVGCAPDNLNVSVDKGTMDVAWTSDCGGTTSGFNIYISEEPITDNYPGTELPAAVKPHNLVPFAGDTNPEDGVEHYEATHLDNGKKYFVSVRILYPDNTVSEPAGEEVVVCGPRGEMELSIRYKSDQDGYSLNDKSYVKSNNSKNDLYFFSKDGKDYLVSPTQLDAFLKANKLKKLSLKGDFSSIRKEASSLTNIPTEERIEIKKGDWLWLIDPEKKSTLLKVLDITGKGEQRKIKLFYAFSPLSGEMIF